MTKLSLNLALILLLSSNFISLNKAATESESPSPLNIKIKQPKDIKIRIEDGGSRVLTQEEARNLSPDQIAEAKPVDSKPIAEIQQPGVKIEKEEQKGEGEEAQLPPIPPSLLFPSSILNNLPPFVQQILNSNLLGSNPIAETQSSSSSDSTDVKQEEGEQPQQPKRILSILLMKSMNKQDQNEQEGAVDQQQPIQPIRSSFFIFRFMPKSNPESNQAEEDKNLILGGDNDPDSKLSLFKQSSIRLGGGGENDPDMLRFKIEKPGLFVGNDEVFINKHDDDDDDNDDDDDDNEPKSFFDRIRSILMNRRTQQQNNNIVEQEEPNQMMIQEDNQYRTASNLNKCLMMSFIRLRASMYYRTVLHLLFFSGLLLFILFMILLTIKSYRRRRIGGSGGGCPYYSSLRNSGQIVATIETKDPKSAASILNLINSPDVIKTSMPAPPPSYDQQPPMYQPIKDLEDTKSLPPEYPDELEGENAKLNQ